MGGIAAALMKDGRPADDAVARMLRAASHRGAVTRIASLGHVSIGVSAHEDANDADVERTNDLMAVFAGSLDNADELGKALQRDGAHPVSMGPAGLLLELYRRDAEDAVSRMRGRFAAVVTDGRRLVFFRDHLGFETAFWREDGRGVFVASEAKQVLAGAEVTPGADAEVLEAIFYSDIQDHERCALRGASRAICGNVYVADVRGVQRRRYWRPEGLLETAHLSSDEIQDRFDELMTQATARALTGQDAVALSGGIDSPAVAAYAAPAFLERTGRPLQALSSVYPDHPAADESRYIEAVAEHFGMSLHTYTPAGQRLDRLEEFTRLFDGPWSVWSPLGADEQFRIARRLGVRNIMTGEMAEQVAAMQLGLVAYLLSKGRVSAAARFIRLERARGRGRRSIIKEMGWTVLPRWGMAMLSKRRPVIAIPAWLDAERAGRARANSALPGRRYWPVSQVGAFGDGSSLSLEASSIIQARDGMRIRMPWSDVDLWEFFVSLRAEVKFPDPQMKALVRQLLRERVPDLILDRRDKTVLNTWFEDTSIDYPSLRRWLRSPEFRMPGVDYELLGRSLEAEDMRLDEYIWAKDLAAMHAFVSLW